jgi:hypothetical protein
MEILQALHHHKETMAVMVRILVALMAAAAVVVLLPTETMEVVHQEEMVEMVQPQQ